MGIDREYEKLVRVVFVVAMLTSACQPQSMDPLVVVETGSILEIGPTFCRIQGEITELGIDGISQHGFVWSDAPDPSIASANKNELGPASVPGLFSFNIQGLLPNTTYYVKAYGEGGDQKAYGIERSFTTTPPTVPSLHTLQAFAVESYTARAGGQILHDGGSQITASGVCWALHPRPTIDDDRTMDGSDSDYFESILIELEPFTVYFYRAYATNSLGTGYGENFGLITLWDNSVISDIEGNEYKTVQIGDQVWMAENLRAGRYSDGSDVQLVETSEDWSAVNANGKAYCYYQNDELLFQTYGALYTWSAATKGEESNSEESNRVQGICPDGWHLPADNEWKQLEVQLGMSDLMAMDDGWRGWDEGGKLKQPGTLLWIEPNLFGTNESGFSAIPAGFRDSSGIFRTGGSFTAFWSSRGASNGEAWLRGLHADRGEMLRDRYPRTSGFSVRCVKDE